MDQRTIAPRRLMFVAVCRITADLHPFNPIADERFYACTSHYNRGPSVCENVVPSSRL